MKNLGKHLYVSKNQNWHYNLKEWQSSENSMIDKHSSWDWFGNMEECWLSTGKRYCVINEEPNNKQVNLFLRFIFIQVIQPVIKFACGCRPVLI